MFTNVNVNCCRASGYKNLGSLNSQDHVAQGKNTLCRECGYLFPMISEQLLNIYRNIVNHPWRGSICQCSTCGSTSPKKYGYSTQSQRRMYCHHCGKIFITLEHVITTPRGTQLASMAERGEVLVDVKRSLLPSNTGFNRELLKLVREANYEESRQYFPASDITLSTCASCAKYNGSNNPLYALVIAEEQSGRMAAISTNYSPSAVKQHYQYTSNYEERMSPGTLTHHAQRKELPTMRRDTLLDIDYGPAVLHRSDPGILVKPALPTYRHFELVRILTDEHSNNVQHYLDHEHFTLGGCLMTNLQHIHQGHYHIFFVKECDVAPAITDSPPRLFLSGGVWNNVQRAFSNHNYLMAVCNLAGSRRIREVWHVTLNSTARFIRLVESHPFLISLSQVFPTNAVSTLDILRHLWDKELEHGTI